MCVYEGTGINAYTYVYACMWSSEFDVTVFHFHLLRQDLLKKELSHLARLVSHLTQRSPVSATGALRLQVDCHTYLTFRWGLGIWTLILTPVWPEFYPLSISAAP